MYLKGLLDKLGVKADFIRIGPHKSAPEQFTNEHAGPVAAPITKRCSRAGERLRPKPLALPAPRPRPAFARRRATGRSWPRRRRRPGSSTASPSTTSSIGSTKELVGRGVGYQKYSDETRAPSTFGARGKVAILYLDGDIVDGRSQHIPLVDMKLVGSYSMAESIKQLREDSSVRAVVLRIESPGGSSLASDVMWRELVLLGQRPSRSSCRWEPSRRAAGTTWPAPAGTSTRFPLTITGSIGVFYGKADVSGLLDKIGVTVDTYKTAPRADAESFYRGFTPDETRELEHKVDQFYDTFLDRVSQGRGMKKEAIDAIGRGRVWTGQQAFDRHLVDHLGGIREALADARASAFLPDDAPIVEYPSPEYVAARPGPAARGRRRQRPRGHAALHREPPPPFAGIARAMPRWSSTGATSPWPASSGPSGVRMGSSRGSVAFLVLCM